MHIDHQICTTLTGGGDVYLGNCRIVSSYYYCLFDDSPSGLQPDDINDDMGGGGSVTDGTLCPHPSIPDAFVECNTCLWLDENGNCTTQNPYKLCANTLNFVQVGDAFTAEIVGLGALIIHKPSFNRINVEFGTTCVKLSARNGYIAAELFALAYNNARDELDVWADAQEPSTLNTLRVENKLKDLLEAWLYSYSTNISYRQSCQGNIPVSNAGYDTDC